MEPETESFSKNIKYNKLIVVCFSKAIIHSDFKEFTVWTHNYICYTKDFCQYIFMDL
jgi:hypothetical protein